MSSRLRPMVCALVLFVGLTTAVGGARAEVPQNADAVINLPEAFQEMHAAAGGRLLVVHLQKARKLVVVDVLKGEIAKEIAAPSDDIFFACSQDQLVIASPSKKLLMRYSLKTFEREKVAPSPDNPIKGVIMGCTSNGPVYLAIGGNAAALNLTTLTPIKTTGSAVGTGRISADGRCVVSHSSENLYIRRLTGNNIATTKIPGGYNYGWLWFQPTADGSLLLSGGHLRDHAGLETSGEPLKGSVPVPCADPRFFLTVSGDRNRTEMSVWSVGERKRLVTVKDLPSVTGSSEPGKWGGVWDKPGAAEPTVFLLPADKMLAVVNWERITIRRFDLFQAIADAGGPPVVISNPPYEAAVGETLTYRMEAISKAGGPAYRLESAPDGMQVSAAGEITWKPTERPVGGKASVIVAVKDKAGAESLHSFDLDVVRRDVVIAVGSETPKVGNPGPATKVGTPTTKSPLVTAKPELPAKTATTKKTDPVPTPTKKTDPVPTPAKKADPTPTAEPRPTRTTEAAGAVVRLSDGRLELPERFRIIRGGPRTLVLSGERLSALSADGSKVERVYMLPKKYVDVAERPDYFVAITAEPDAVDILDKKTLERMRGRKLSYRGLTGIALHPTKPVSYIAVRKAGDHNFEYRFIVVDETTCEGRERDSWIATWIAVDPNGRFLITGYMDYLAGGLITPDELRRFSLDGDGSPAPFPSQVRREAGGNGNGVRISHDGKRVTYLSVGGYPKFSANLGGWDTSDFERLPVPYETKERGTTTELEFHPKLPLAVSPGKDSVAFFDQESGDVLANKVTLPPDAFAAAKLHSAFFSADGTSLLIEHSVRDVHYLYRVPLNLTPAERKKL